MQPVSLYLRKFGFFRMFLKDFFKETLMEIKIRSVKFISMQYAILKEDAQSTRVLKVLLGVER